LSTGNGYTELQDSTANQNKLYQSLTNSSSTHLPKFHQYEEVENDKGRQLEVYSHNGNVTMNTVMQL